MRSHCGSCMSFFASLVPKQAMEAPRPARPTLLLTTISESVVEGIISEFMVSDVFILVVSQANAYAHGQCRVRERRFFLRLEHGLWVYRDALRGAGAPIAA